jgi:hypothetical protein
MLGGVSVEFEEHVGVIKILATAVGPMCHTKVVTATDR